MRIALIGCGAAARRYYVPALKALLNRRDTLCLVDSDVAQASALAREFAAAVPAADYRSIRDGLDGAIVAVPPAFHHGIARDLLAAGIPVLCEKPLADTAAQVHDLVVTATRARAALCVNNTRRLFPSFRAVRSLLETNAIGRLRSINYVEGNTFEWQSATGFYVDPRVSSKGVLQDVGSHVLDVVCWWLGQTPELTSYHDDSFGGPESVADVRARVGPCDVRVFLNRLNNLESRFRLTGERGAIEGTLYGWQELEVTIDGARAVRRYGPRVRTYPEFVRPVVQNFLRVVAGTEAPLVAGSAVEPSIAFIEECYANRRSPGRNWSAAAGPARTERILVTGAAGFIGASVVEHLHLAGREVRAGIRSWATAARVGRLPVDVAILDVTSPESVARALDGVTHVVHCAKGGAGATDLGTRLVLDEAHRCGVARFVHLSTADVYGHATGTVDETAPLRHSGTEYNRTKIEAERACWRVAEAGLPLVVLRPSIVYGPFSRNWSVRFATAFLAGRGTRYARIGDGKCNLVYIDDLVSAIVAALDRAGAAGRAFNVVGRDVVSWNEYFERFNDAMGLPPLPLIGDGRAAAKTHILQPVRLAGQVVRTYCMPPVRAIATRFDLADRALKATERLLKMTPAPEDLTLFGRDVVFSGNRAATHLGFSPAFSLDQGLEATVRWLGDQGFFLGREAPSRPTVTSAPAREPVVP